MKLTLSSDYHLYTKRQAHTTPDSARRLQQSLYEKALQATSYDTNLCLGDLFDKAHNDETALIQGYNIVKRCDVVIAGNHDETNREGSNTTLRALEAVTEDVIVSVTDISTAQHYDVGAGVFVVPHHASQELFDQAMREAAQSASLAEEPHAYLLLHCNYDIPFDSEDSTLNLSPELAEELLQVFSRIFIGHEHNPKEHFDGRLVLVGNTHPTSFSDISDKYVWHLDTEIDELTKECIWAEEDHYRALTYGEPIPNLEGVQFVEVVGAEPAEDATEVAQFVRQVWNTSPSLLAVRNNVEIIDHLSNTNVDTSKPALVDLRKRIHEDLEGSDLQPVYSRLVAKAEGA